MTQPVPEVTDADVARIVRRDFSPDLQAEVLAALATYGAKSWHREPVRVRLALLKLANGSPDKLRQNLATADTDYRDVLSYAEYPGYFTRIGPSDRDPAARQQAIDRDWAQYRRWLERP